jgi:hypothetical protein
VCRYGYEDGPLVADPHDCLPTFEAREDRDIPIPLSWREFTRSKKSPYPEKPLWTGFAVRILFVVRILYVLNPVVP